jgi:hypothetical protein
MPLPQDTACHGCSKWSEREREKETERERERE